MIKQDNLCYLESNGKEYESHILTLGYLFFKCHEVFIIHVRQENFHQKSRENMSLDTYIREIIQEEVRTVVRQELAKVLDEIKKLEQKRG